MTELDEGTQSEKRPETEVDAVRRHICQVLGFDYGFLDSVRGHEIKTLQIFSAADDGAEAHQFVGTLVDEHKQPVVAANTHVAQKVKQTQRAWVGKIFTTANSTIGGSTEPAQLESFPYAIIPVVENPGSPLAQVRGLIRVISFDGDREISLKDLQTLRLMAEHLFNQLPFSNEVQAAEAEKAVDPFDQDCVLVVHSKRPIRRRYTRILGSQYQVLEADNGDKTLELLPQTKVDLILLDSEITGTTGYAFCKVLKESQWKDIPIILVTLDTNPASRVEGLNVGADDCLSESCFDSELLARVKSSLKHRKAERELSVQLQLLEDYAQRLEKAHEDLSKDKNLEVQRSNAFNKALRDTEVLRNQEVLLHRISNIIRSSFNINENLHEMLVSLAGWRNLQCCFTVMPKDDEPEDSIRAESAQTGYSVKENDLDLSILNTYIEQFQNEQVILSNDFQNERRLESIRFLLGDYHPLSFFCLPITYENKLLGVLGGFKVEQMAQWNKDNEAFLKSVADQIATGVTNARLYARVQRQATTDGLTGLYNHRTGQEKLSEQLRLAERYQRNLSVVMIDVDHFKSINDNYGHPAGDTVLKAVSRLVRSEIRDVDFPVRYGGEEILLILPEVNPEGAVIVAERIRKNLEAEVMRHEGIEIKVTASFGVSSFPEDAKMQQSLLDLADKSLYLSKRLGRNQVHSASDLMFEDMTVSKDAEVAKGIIIPPPKLSQFIPTAISEAAEMQEELVPEVVEMVKALATALYSKSDYNKVHHLETARLSELLAKVMGLNQQQIEQIRVAGLLHDVGTLSIPSDLINKVGFLTAQERYVMNQHPVLGAQLLRPIRALRDICEILENHHERWDGTGFPKGLKGEEIPLPARIVAIVDSYHALISDRPYRKAMSHEEAIQVLKEGAGYQWDPFLTDIFIAVLRSLKDYSDPSQMAVSLQAQAHLAQQSQNQQPQQNMRPGLPPPANPGGGQREPDAGLH
ncbi:MAG: diguanylate cyclase [Candidatus Obscuribacterales bacterium]|nr:diguanylate cyclase [Candidatus Obscuribacterales bacterium]